MTTKAKKTDPRLAEAEAALVQALGELDRARAQCDHLAAALQDIIDAHYHWREHGEGKTGPEAESAAQRFIDARTSAHAALAQVPGG